ncbi:hypothetical protein [Luteolibacter sp. Populi]|uniref:hypothetical protein n=1 Tax=Luteolibacter sp. Populi TaxID=3230487 RepID=UPI003465BE83
MKTSITFTEDLHGAAKAQAQAHGYDSLSAYLVALIRLDILSDGTADHSLAQRIGGLPFNKRDAIDAKMLRTAEDAVTRWEVADTTTAEVDKVIRHRFEAPAPAPLSRFRRNPTGISPNRL